MLAAQASLEWPATESAATTRSYCGRRHSAWLRRGSRQAKLGCTRPGDAVAQDDEGHLGNGSLLLYMRQLHGGLECVLVGTPCVPKCEPEDHDLPASSGVQVCGPATVLGPYCA